MFVLLWHVSLVVNRGRLAQIWQVHASAALKQTGPGFTSTSPALRRSSRRCWAGWAAPVVKKGGCAPPMAQAVCVGPDWRICVRRLHLLAGHHVKVPDRCLRIIVDIAKLSLRYNNKTKQCISIFNVTVSQPTPGHISLIYNIQSKSINNQCI